MSQLDRSKPFAEVHGDDPRITHRYEQGGKKFDHSGREVGIRAQPPLKAAQAPKVSESKAEEPGKAHEIPAQSQLKSQLSEV